MLAISPFVKILPQFAWPHKNMLDHKADIILCIERIAACPERWALSPMEQCSFMSEQSKGVERVGPLPLSNHTPVAVLVTLKDQSQ